MNKYTFYTIIIAGLLISNVLLVIFALDPSRPRGFDPDRPRNIIIGRLDLDEEQVRRYDILIQAHRTDIAAKDREIMHCKSELYAYLTQEKGPAPLDSLSGKIGQLQQEVEKIHYAHFLQIRALCRPEQLSAFDALSRDIAGIFNPPHPRPR
ncbi:MAG: periplasmic heavy metal sensor [Bacteroidia bacterium]|nr:periplasmic heavy metal sensor [Bacteroidia bacterium]